MRDPPLRGVGGGWKYSRGIEMAAAPPSVPRERGKGWGNGGSDERIFWRPPTGVNIPLQRQERQGENSSPAYLVCHRNSLKTSENYQLAPPECTSWRDTHRERVHRHGPRDFGLKVRRGEGGKTCKTHTHTQIYMIQENGVAWNQKPAALNWVGHFGIPGLLLVDATARLRKDEQSPLQWELSIWASF